MTEPSGQTGLQSGPGPGGRASRVATMIGALVPGTGHLIVGRRAAGTALLAAWLAFLGIAIATWSRIGAVPSTGSLDDWIAVVTLANLLVGIWLIGAFTLAAGPPAAVTGVSQWRLAWRQFRRNRLAVAGLVTICALYAITLLAPLLAPYDPGVAPDIVASQFVSPSPPHWLGTDRLGRDILSRILFGARVSLTIGFVATAISVTVGTLIGSIAGYAGGRVDAVLMRFTDLVLSFPRLVLLILIVALFGQSIVVLILVLGLTQWPSTTRIVRGDVLSLREREFVQAAHALGFGRGRVLLRHLIPNVLAPVIVSATLGIGNTIVLEAGLSFLGLGPPVPTWGAMVEAGRDVLIEAWWVATFPGLAIVFVVLAFNLVGDGLRDALDPRLR